MKKPFRTWKSWQIAVVGMLSFMVSAYYLFILGNVLPGLLETSNKLPLSEWWPKGFLAWTLCGLLALIVWPFATAAQRCHELLKERWFD